jgi:hypothetical protein
MEERFEDLVRALVDREDGLWLYVLGSGRRCCRFGRLGRITPGLWFDSGFVESGAIEHTSDLFCRIMVNA